MTQAWLIRAGRAGEREKWALRSGVSGGGFHEVPDLTAATTREDVTEIVANAFAGDKQVRIQNFAAQLWALRQRMQVGDFVVMPLKTRPVLAIGQISGGYEFRNAEDPSLRHTRPVDWIATDVPRTAVKQDLLYSLGAFLTICEIRRNDAVQRIKSLAETGTDPGARTPLKSVSGQPAPPPDSEDGELSEGVGGPIDIEQHAFDRLSNFVIENFAGYKMQTLVAAVLEAEGFTCKVPPEGPDQGIDVLAGKGPLGLDDPRLVVQVKSEISAVGSTVVQQLLGAMNTHQAEQGLLVAWGGVKKPAENLLSSQYFRVRVWSSKELLEAVFRNYERLPEEIRNDLPLKRIWALVEEPG